MSVIKKMQKKGIDEGEEAVEQEVGDRKKVELENERLYDLSMGWGMHFTTYNSSQFLEYPAGNLRQKFSIELKRNED